MPARRSTSRSYFAFCATFGTAGSSSSARSGAIDGSSSGGRFFTGGDARRERARGDARRLGGFAAFAWRAASSACASFASSASLARVVSIVAEQQVALAGCDRAMRAAAGSTPRPAPTAIEIADERAIAADRPPAGCPARSPSRCRRRCSGAFRARAIMRSSAGIVSTVT